MLTDGFRCCYSQVVKFSVSAALVQNHPARALRLVHKQFEEKPTRELENKMMDLFQQLKWSHCHVFFNRSLPLKYPSAYRPFWNGSMIVRYYENDELENTISKVYFYLGFASTLLILVDIKICQLCESIAKQPRTRTVPMPILEWVKIVQWVVQTSTSISLSLSDFSSSTNNMVGTCSTGSTDSGLLLYNDVPCMTLLTYEGTFKSCIRDEAEVLLESPTLSPAASPGANGLSCFPPGVWVLRQPLQRQSRQAFPST